MLCPSSSAILIVVSGEKLLSFGSRPKPRNETSPAERVVPEAHRGDPRAKIIERAILNGRAPTTAYVTADLHPADKITTLDR